MSVIRINKTKNYTVMSNCHLKEKELSLKAKGLLSQMLSLPDNWDYSIAGLAAINKESIGVIRSTLDELKSFGYLVVTKKMPNETASGRIEYVYDIYEAPQKQHKEKQGIENQYIEIQHIENDRQLKTKKSITKKSNTNILKTYNDEFEDIWSEYPRKLGKDNALKAYIKARRSGVDRETIEQGVENYVDYIKENRVEEKYIKHGSTWFNKQCWNDVYKKKKKNSNASYDIEELMKIE